jgi:hypothetical protein
MIGDRGTFELFICWICGQLNTWDGWFGLSPTRSLNCHGVDRPVHICTKAWLLTCHQKPSVMNRDRPHGPAGSQCCKAAGQPLAAPTECKTVASHPIMLAPTTTRTSPDHHVHPDTLGPSQGPPKNESSASSSSEPPKALKWLDREVQSGRIARENLTPCTAGEGDKRPFKSDMYLRSYSKKERCVGRATTVVARSTLVQPGGPTVHCIRGTTRILIPGSADFVPPRAMRGTGVTADMPAPVLEHGLTFSSLVSAYGRGDACRQRSRPWWVKLFVATAATAQITAGVVLTTSGFGLIASCIRTGTVVSGAVCSFGGTKLATAGFGSIQKLRNRDAEPVRIAKPLLPYSL